MKPISVIFLTIILSQILLCYNGNAQGNNCVFLKYKYERVRGRDSGYSGTKLLIIKNKIRYWENCTGFGQCISNHPYSYHKKKNTIQLKYNHPLTDSLVKVDYFSLNQNDTLFTLNTNSIGNETPDKEVYTIYLRDERLLFNKNSIKCYVFKLLRGYHVNNSFKGTHHKKIFFSKKQLIPVKIVDIKYYYDKVNKEINYDKFLKSVITLQNKL